MTLAQKIVLIITAILLFLIGATWLFSDASLGHTLDGLIAFYLVIGVPAYLIFKALGRK